jgi:hypothetical protein
MIFLIFSSRATSSDLKLSPEFSEYAWVPGTALRDYNLNSATVETFRQAGAIN